jgi:hypothetical protein
MTLKLTGGVGADVIAGEASADVNLERMRGLSQVAVQKNEPTGRAQAPLRGSRWPGDLTSLTICNT